MFGFCRNYAVCGCACVLRACVRLFELVQIMRGLNCMQFRSEDVVLKKGLTRVTRESRDMFLKGWCFKRRCRVIMVCGFS